MTVKLNFSSDKFNISRDREEINSLIKKAKKGDRESTDKLFNKFARLIMHITNSYGYSSKEDLFQEAAVGFMKAVKNFDVDYGSSFPSFLDSYVRSAINEYLTRNEHAIYSFTTKGLRKARNNIRHYMKDGSIDEKTKVEMAKNLDISISDIDGAIERMKISAVSSITKDGQTEDIVNFIESQWNSIDELEEEDDLEYRRRELKRRMSKMSEDWQYLIKVRHLNDTKLTHREIAEMQGVSLQAVAQREKKALKRLMEAA